MILESLRLRVWKDGRKFGRRVYEVIDLSLLGDYAGEEVRFTKQYIGKHSVQYSGKWDKVSLRGRWSISGNSSGAFLLKPQ